MGDYRFWLTPKRPFEVPEVLEVHEVPSDEVRMVPELPTATKNPEPEVEPNLHS